ncbi:hypothetical protein GCM10010293_01590 [Streptomyces griseoflavus]|nr:hypothetical protein GCM10010293_01590 [Streptomyces griseoflavus]
MTAPKRKKARANGEGTIYRRKDGRWEAAGHVLAPGNTVGASVSTAPPARKPWPTSPGRSPPATAAFPCPPRKAAWPRTSLPLSPK